MVSHFVMLAVAVCVAVATAAILVFFLRRLRKIQEEHWGAKK